MTSGYRLSGAVVVRLLGLALAAAGLFIVLLVVLVGVLSLPSEVLGAGVLVVVRLDEDGYHVRYVRGAGVRSARWAQVEDVSAVTVAGERCVVLHLRDGRTTTVPVGVLAGRPDDFVRDLQRHLDRGHGYRPLPR